MAFYIRSARGRNTTHCRCGRFAVSLYVQATLRFDSRKTLSRPIRPCRDQTIPLLHGGCDRMHQTRDRDFNKNIPQTVWGRPHFFWPVPRCFLGVEMIIVQMSGFHVDGLAPPCCSGSWVFNQPTATGGLFTAASVRAKTIKLNISHVAAHTGMTDC